MVDTIKELSDLSRKLNQKSDTLNEVITSINEKLAKLNLGVESWVSEPIESDDPYYHPYDEDRKFPRREATLLGYCKFGESWALVVKEVTLKTNSEIDEGYEEIETATAITSLLSSSRSIRANAMRLIPRLLDGIKIKAESLLESIERAEQAAAKL